MVPNHVVIIRREVVVSIEIFDVDVLFASKQIEKEDREQKEIYSMVITEN